MREIVLDTETTGLNHAFGDRIIEIGCVELINHVATNNTLQFYCKVDKKISEEASKITGITNEFLEKEKTFEEQHEKLINFIKNDPLVMHNAKFDLGFINNELMLLGKEKITNEIIDTVTLARKVLNTRIANLDFLCRHFNIDLSKRSLHGALLDSRLLAEVYLELKGGKQISMDLRTVEKNKNQKNNKNKHEANKTKSINPNDEDTASHKKMLEKIKEPIWKRFDYYYNKN